MTIFFSESALVPDPRAEAAQKAVASPPEKAEKPKGKGKEKDKSKKDEDKKGGNKKVGRPQNSIPLRFLVAEASLAIDMGACPPEGGQKGGQEEEGRGGA